MTPHNTETPNTGTPNTGTQHIFITAGGSGIGLAMAKAFLDTGAQVAITDSNSDMLAAAKAAHPALHIFTADATSEEQMQSAFDTVMNMWGGLDVMMANAGIAGPTASIEDVKLDDWQRCLAVNLDGSFLAAKLATPVMKAQKSGVITLTSSTAGQWGYPYRSPYAAAKWGIIGLMKTLAMELGSSGIRVNAICPGSVEGERMDGVIVREAAARGITPEELRQGYADCASLRRFVTAEDVADMAVFLASPQARSITGMTMSVDGHTEKVTL